MNRVLLFLFLSILISACTQTKPKTVGSDVVVHKEKLQYAKGFEIRNFKGYKTLRILKAFKDDNHQITYYLIPKSVPLPDSLQHKNIIRTPVERIVLTSTTHIPMVELLGRENTIIGFPNTAYISSPKTRQLIDNGIIKELGQEQNINTEILIDIQPELVVGFGVDHINKTFKTIEKLGISVIYNSDWLEETPLGRAEWIRFFGALYNLDSIAQQKFDSIVTHYNTLKKTIRNVQKHPTVLSGALFHDTWHLPAGKSFVAQFITDAGGDYLWKNTLGTGSLSLSFETVLDKGKDADFWIAPGYYASKKAMENDSPHYTQFKSFTQNRVYTYSNTKGVTGGVLYYELAATRPDLVLQDLIQILHPEIQSGATMTFFKKLE